MSSRVSTQDALTFVMVTMSTADGAVSDTELNRIGQLVQRLPVFEGYTQEDLNRAAKTCTAILVEADNGLDIILDAVAESVPPSHYDTAYALAVDVAASDLQVEQEELRFLQMLSDRLELEPLVVAAIERTARARYRKLKIDA